MDPQEDLVEEKYHQPRGGRVLLTLASYAKTVSVRKQNILREEEIFQIASLSANGFFGCQLIKINTFIILDFHAFSPLAGVTGIG